MTGFVVKTWICCLFHQHCQSHTTIAASSNRSAYSQCSQLIWILRTSSYCLNNLFLLSQNWMLLNR